MKIKVVTTLLGVTILLSTKSMVSACSSSSSNSVSTYTNADPDLFREEFDEAKSQCEAALSGSCDLGVLNGLAGQLDSFGDDPTSSEETEIVANNGGLNFFCKKSVAMFQCILQVIDGDQCEAYRQFSGIDDAIDDIREGFNQLVEKCPRDIKNMHHVVKKFLKHYN